MPELYLCFVLRYPGVPVKPDDVRCVPAPPMPQTSQPYRIDPRLGGKPYATQEQMQEYQRAEAEANTPNPIVPPIHPNY